MEYILYPYTRFSISPSLSHPPSTLLQPGLDIRRSMPGVLQSTAKMVEGEGWRRREVEGEGMRGGGVERWRRVRGGG